MQTCKPNFLMQKDKDGEGLVAWGGVLAGCGVEWHAGAFVRTCVEGCACMGGCACVCVHAYACGVCVCLRACMGMRVCVSFLVTKREEVYFLISSQSCVFLTSRKSTFCTI